MLPNHPFQNHRNAFENWTKNEKTNSDIHNLFGFTAMNIMITRRW